jgi:hypothetical protein
VPVEQLLHESDTVSLHLRLNIETPGDLGKQRLALMKPTAFFTKATMSHGLPAQSVAFEWADGQGREGANDKPVQRFAPLATRAVEDDQFAAGLHEVFDMAGEDRAPASCARSRSCSASGATSCGRS